MRHRGLLSFGLGTVIALAFGWFAFPYALYRPIDQPIQFSHKVHTGEKGGMSCDDCHALSAEGRIALPKLETCAGCHTEPIGKSSGEKTFVDQYVSKNREVPWLVYARQPANVWFSHAPHVKLAGIKCERCHGPHGESDLLPAFEQNRISSYSRHVESSLLPIRSSDREGMKMTDCSRCHHQSRIDESCLTCHK